MPENDEYYDYFVSYNHNDEEWAVWIASVLENAGKSTIIQAWDFDAGSNFVLEMQRAAARSDRTIVVLSPTYLRSEYTQPEWAAAFARDPGGAQRKLVPVRVASCQPDGLLSQIVYIDLVGIQDPDAAARKLIAELQPGRSRPLGHPAFPGVSQSEEASANSPVPEIDPSLIWQPLDQSLPIHWRSSVVRSTGRSVLEVHLVPVGDQRLEVRRLAALPDELTALGRLRGIFSTAEEVDRQSSDQFAAVFTDDPRDKTTGLIVGRNGQRGAWFTLPHDTLGSVFDPDDVRPRVQAFLELLTSLPIPRPEAVGVGLALGPLMMLSTGSANVINHRTSASMSFTSTADIQQTPTESVVFGALTANTTDVADEIVARLDSALRNR